MAPCKGEFATCVRMRLASQRLRNCGAFTEVFTAICQLSCNALGRRTAAARVCIQVALQERAAQLVGKAGVEIALLLRKDGNAGVVGKAGLALRGAWVFFVVTSSSTFICADS